MFLTRCLSALREHDGDVGVALEQLLTKAFDMEKSYAAKPKLSDEEASLYKDMKEDEKMALESIYGESFSEKIPGKVHALLLFWPLLKSVYLQRTL